MTKAEVVIEEAVNFELTKNDETKPEVEDEHSVTRLYEQLETLIDDAKGTETLLELAFEPIEETKAV